MNTLTLYFDESGFTGENLLNPSQKTFAYASVNITPDKADKLVSKIIDKYKIQNGELKGINLIRRTRGKNAILEILQEIQNDIKISIDDKRYALAGKFFEYIFEPILAQKSSIFYQLNFHKYISNVLYISFVSNDSIANDMLVIFEELVRKKDFSLLEKIISLLEKKHENRDIIKFFTDILLFIDIHQETIYNEIKDLPLWTNDLSISSLNSLFSEWGETKKEIIAFCDNSKPIEAQKDFFKNMMGRTDIVYHPFINNDGKPIPMTYNLKELNLVDSKEHAGIQLADIVATASTYTFQMNEEKNEFTDKYFSILNNKIAFGSVFPDFNHIDLKKKEVRLNAYIFEEIISRTKNKISILDDIESAILYGCQQLQYYPSILKR